METFNKFFCMISAAAITVSAIGVILLIRTLFFCIKRYIMYYFDENTELCTISFSHKDTSQELGPDEIVKKMILKDKIDKFARDTCNMVKSNNYLSERSENVIDEAYNAELEKLSKIYIQLDKMKIDTSDDLEEVDFLFNQGKLRSDDEIISFYKERKNKENMRNYYEKNFIKDLIQAYEESKISSKIIASIGMILFSYGYFYYKLYIDTMFTWKYKDVCLFIYDMFRITFKLGYTGHLEDWSGFVEDGNHFFFSLSLLLSGSISFIACEGLILINDWIKQFKIFKIYDKAGEKKKPDILLGVNTASYLYVLHKLLKKRK